MNRLSGCFSICMMAGCLFAPVTLSLTQLFFYLALLFLGITFIKEGGRSKMVSPITWGAWLFAATALLSIFTGHYFAESLSRCHRLLLLLFIPGLPYAVKVYKDLSMMRLLQAMTAAFLVGTCCLALYDIIRVPVYARKYGSWFDAGNMRDPQFYLIGLCLLAAGLRFPGPLRKAGVTLGVAVAYTAALILHFKRGTWLSLVTVLSLLGLVQRKWKALGGGLLLLAVVLLLPPVQDRLGNLKNEFTPHYGGRLDLWQNVAPDLIKNNPFGLGFKATQFSDLRKYHMHVGSGLDHLHNNLLSVTAETGIPGGLAWLGFMIATLVVSIQSIRYYSGSAPVHATLALGWCLAYCGLHLNGLVEYNFGDSELYILFCLIAAIQNYFWSERRQASTG